MTKLYTIPEIKWKTALLHQDGIVREVKFTEDTFIDDARREKSRPFSQ